MSSGLPLDINYRIGVSDGQYRWARARATARVGANGKVLRWYGTLEDIHERHLANEKLVRQAYQDELTGLPNRRRFVEELRARLQQNAPLGLMVLDLDDFKLVNDRFGHITGDAVLRLFARHLRNVAEPNEFVARLGGDEFAIICCHLSTEHSLLERARLIATRLDRLLRANKKSRACKPSVGCAIALADENPDEVFKRADLALYSAKFAGKGAVKLFDPTVRSATTRRAGALELARTALREHWIEPYYQPIVDLRSQEVRGFEALLRIRHPSRGVLAPIEIMDALDDPRTANEIGLRMARLAISDMSFWSASSLKFSQVSLNLATENLVDPDFVAALLKLLVQNHIPLTAIKLEMTERVLLNDMNERIVASLNRLRDSKIQISLDDFGTGYASLVHLQTLPLDEIKIDRSFVSHLGTAINRGEIVQAVLGLAKSLGLSTVAEGIETQGEALRLAAWGCEYGQGFLFGRPMPCSEVVSLLSKSGGKLSIAG